MTHTATLIEQVSQLNPVDQLAFAEQILYRLDEPDASIDAQWAAEARSRLDAWQSGKLATVSSAQVMGKYAHR